MYVNVSLSLSHHLLTLFLQLSSFAPNLTMKMSLICIFCSESLLQIHLSIGGKHRLWSSALQASPQKLLNLQKPRPFKIQECSSKGFKPQISWNKDVTMDLQMFRLPCSWRPCSQQLCSCSWQQLCRLCGWSRSARRRESAGCIPVGGALWCSAPWVCSKPASVWGCAVLSGCTLKHSSEKQHAE